MHLAQRSHLHPLAPLLCAPRSRTRPAMNVSYTDQAYLVSVPLPGVSKDDVSVTFQDKQLFIQVGTKPELATSETEQTEQQPQDTQESTNVVHMVQEFQPTSHLRLSVHIPTPVDESKIQADLRKGVLTVQLPKVVPPQPQAIQVIEHA